MHTVNVIQHDKLLVLLVFRVFCFQTLMSVPLIHINASKFVPIPLAIILATAMRDTPLMIMVSAAQVGRNCNGNQTFIKRH